MAPVNTNRSAPTTMGTRGAFSPTVAASAETAIGPVRSSRHG